MLGPNDTVLEGQKLGVLYFMPLTRFLPFQICRQGDLLWLYIQIKVDTFSHPEGSSALGPTMENVASTQSKPQWQQNGHEGKKAVVHEEMERLHQLPANSSYVTHRLRVLNKILQLLSVQRTISQDEELELLFAGLHL